MVAHNSVTNVAHGMSGPHTNVDIFGHDIFDTSDDGIVSSLEALFKFRTSAAQHHRELGHGLAGHQREDGVGIDQVVLPADRYLTTRPGATKNDTLVLTRTQ